MVVITMGTWGTRGPLAARGSFPHWGDAPTWFYAVVALAALIAAVLAYLKQKKAVEDQGKALVDQQNANLAQANAVQDQLGLQRQALADQEGANLAQAEAVQEQLGLQRQQLADQQAANSQQAEAAREQLDLQRRQLADQQEANRKQAEVLANQLRQLQQSADAITRQQANAITVTPSLWQGAPPGALETRAPTDHLRLHMVLVGNASYRPIRNISCRFQTTANTYLGPAGNYPAESVGRLAKLPSQRGAKGPSPDNPLIGVAEATEVRLLSAGEAAVFISPFEIQECPTVQVIARFTDDAGLPWQIDPDLHLARLDNRDDW